MNYIRIGFYICTDTGTLHPVCITVPQILTYALKADDNANETVQYLIDNIIDILEKKEGTNEGIS